MWACEVQDPEPALEGIRSREKMRREKGIETMTGWQPVEVFEIDENGFLGFGFRVLGESTQPNQPPICIESCVMLHGSVYVRTSYAAPSKTPYAAAAKDFFQSIVVE